MVKWLNELFKKSNSSRIEKNHQQNRCTIKIPPFQTVKKDSEMSHRKHLDLNTQGQNGERSQMKNSADRYGIKPLSSLHLQTGNDTVQNQERESSQQLDEKNYHRKDGRLFGTDRNSGLKFQINQANGSRSTFDADFVSFDGINKNLKKKLISQDHDSDLSINSRLQSNITPNQHQDKEQNKGDSNVDDARVFVTDRISKIRFLVDGGAQRSVYPRSMLPDLNLTPDTNLSLQQSDKNKILTYGTRYSKLDLGLNRNFIEEFLIADVEQPIIGACFIKHNKLFVNHTNNSLNNLSIWHAYEQKYGQLCIYFITFLFIIVIFILYLIILVL